MTMGEQIFSCGRHKNRTFEDIAENEPEFCEAVLKTDVCNKYYPEDFKLYLVSLGRSCPSISERTVPDFIDKWNKAMVAEFQNIIGSPNIDSRTVHPQASNNPNGNLGVFIRYFIKKCIFNAQNTDASSYSVNAYASIFPFRVSKTVPSAKIRVCQLFDDEFYSTIATFMVRHFEDRCDSAVDIIDLFLRNVEHFRREHFNENAMRRLKSVVDSAADSVKSSFAPTHVSNYLKQFPRLSKAGAERYHQLRQLYNSLCAAFERPGLGDQPRHLVRKLPEINCYELLQLLDPNFYKDERSKYTDWFQKYLFFFVYAVESDDDHPIFFIDDPLYECLKDYAEYQSSRDVPERLKLCLWMMTLIHRRIQPLDLKNNGFCFDVDDESLQHIREYVENFPGIESAEVDYEFPTSLLHLNIRIVTQDTILNVCYRKGKQSDLTDFYADIMRALMCPFDVQKAVIYNAYTGEETSIMVPPVRKEVLEFIRRYNKHDPDKPLRKEYIFTKRLESCFEKNTIQWDDKFPKKSNPLPVHKYEEIFGET